MFGSSSSILCSSKPNSILKENIQNEANLPNKNFEKSKHDFNGVKMNPPSKFFSNNDTSSPPTSRKNSSTLSPTGNNVNTHHQQNNNVTVQPLWKMDELFMTWLSKPETMNLVFDLMNEVKTDIPRESLSLDQKKPKIEAPPIGNVDTPSLEEKSLHSSSSQKENVKPSEPSRSLRKTDVSRNLHEDFCNGLLTLKNPDVNNKLPTSISCISHEKKDTKPKVPTEPTFVIPPIQRNVQRSHLEKELKLLEAYGSPNSFTFKPDEMSNLLKKICNMPLFISRVLFSLLDGNKGIVLLSDLIKFWKEHMKGSLPQKIFSILVGGKRKKLYYSDLYPVIEEILEHGDFEFLVNSNHYQLRYMEAVAMRIWYTLCPRRTTSINFIQFERKCEPFLDALREAETCFDFIQDDGLFSYKHFYVIYCKFAELDVGQELTLTQSQLANYGNQTLTSIMVERLFDFPSLSGQCPPGCITFLDFVWIILCIEDKNSESSIEFWFRCLDMDGDGYLSGYEMEYFYQYQWNRLDGWDEDPLSWDDLFCLLLDMIKPLDPLKISVMDIKKSQMGGVFFNSLFDTNKFLFAEKTEPYDNPRLTDRSFSNDWEHFVKVEFEKFSSRNTNTTNNNSKT